MSDPKEKQTTPKAFVIVDGKRAVSLERPVTHIGRKSDNHIVVKNPHVSRYHAQIRNIKGRFILMDLESTVGTSVNGEKVNQVYLNPGDVISIGGAPLIFGQGTPQAPLELPETGPQNVLTGPTDTVQLSEADAYLDFFSGGEDDEENGKSYGN